MEYSGNNLPFISRQYQVKCSFRIICVVLSAVIAQIHFDRWNKITECESTKKVYEKRILVSIWVNNLTKPEDTLFWGKSTIDYLTPSSVLSELSLLVEEPSKGIKQNWQILDYVSPHGTNWQGIYLARSARENVRCIYRLWNNTCMCPPVPPPRFWS